MKKTLLSILFSLNSLLILAQSANIQNVWLERNVDHDGENCVIIHTKFDQNNLGYGQAVIIAAIYDGWGNPITYRGNRSKFIGPDREMVVYDILYPQYKSSTYNDFCLYLPTKEVPPPSSGYANYIVNVAIICSGRVLDSWDYTNDNDMFCLSKTGYLAYSRDTSLPPYNSSTSNSSTGDFNTFLHDVQEGIDNVSKIVNGISNIAEGLNKLFGE